MKYNFQIYHRRSVRLKGYAYAKEGLYFITICTKDREHFFGEIKTVGTSKVIFLSEIGQFANECWLNIPNHFPNAVLHEHIVMPNHILGIIELADHANAVASQATTVPHSTDVLKGKRAVVSLSRHQNKFSKPVAGSLSVIVQQFKSSLTQWCNKNGHEYFQWQGRFRDHITRNEQSYQNISVYIIGNPSKWHEDKF